MATVNRLIFDYKEVVTSLLKKEGIHEGIWALYVEFGLVAINAPLLEEGETAAENPLDRLKPTAILPIQKIGIQRTKELSSIAVDAAIVNPKPKSTAARKSPKNK